MVQGQLEADKKKLSNSWGNLFKLLWTDCAYLVSDCFGKTIVEQKQVNTRNVYNTVLL